MFISLPSFLASIEAGDPPPLSAPLRALWLDARGDWDGAHKCVDAREDKQSCWAHAYLHRKEGDLWNARYWYARAGRPPCEGPLEEEWREIAAALLAAEA
ncbi:hypothetical protein [Methylocystis parvus]|uniref:hypothetical protein n=1 Tax=Methylocystis parvus TaxID=134 RepID=UPI003C719FD7